MIDVALQIRIASSLHNTVYKISIGSKPAPYSMCNSAQNLFSSSEDPGRCSLWPQFSVLAAVKKSHPKHLYTAAHASEHRRTLLNTPEHLFRVFGVFRSSKTQVLPSTHARLRKPSQAKHP